MNLPASLLGLIGLSSAAAIEPHRRQAPNTVQPVFFANFPDPSMMRSNEQWYAYATNEGPTHVQLATSPDFTNWDYQAGFDVMPQLPPWVDAANPNVWAPKVWQRDDGVYVMYYTAAHVPITMDNGASRQPHCIGVATSTNPQGPFETIPGDAFICPTAQGGAIDPSHFQDTDGQHYITYKIDGNNIGHGGVCGNSNPPIVPTPIMLQKVGDDGITLIDAPVQILDRDDGDGPLVEAPSIAKMWDGQYYLFYSSNCWNSLQYDIAYAVGPSVAGPYTKAGVLLNTGAMGLQSPGGADLSPDGTKLLFHANVQQQRALFAATLGPASQGVPELGFMITFQ